MKMQSIVYHRRRKINTQWKTQAIVFPEYASLFIEHVCPIYSTQPCTLTAPDLVQQIEIVRHYHEIEHMHSVQYLRGYILWCLLHNQEETLQTLLDAADAYWLSLHIVRDIVTTLENITSIPNPSTL